MTDQQTLAAYDQGAAAFADDWHTRPLLNEELTSASSGKTIHRLVVTKAL